MDYAQIVEGCKRHEAKAQRALYDATAPMAMGVCMRYSSGRAEAEDMMQDGYVRVYEKIGRMREPEHLMAWVYRIMVNSCIDRCKKQRWEMPMDDLEAVVEPMVFKPCQMQDIVDSMQQLDVRQRMVFNLYAVEGYSTAEVAQMMGCTEVNVRVILARARRKMRDYLA